MEVEEYLGRIMKYEKMIECKQRELGRMERMVMKGGDAASVEKIRMTIGMDIVMLTKMRDVAIDTIFDVLSAEQAEGICRRWVFGMGLKEIAKDMGYSYGYVRKIHIRGMAELEKMKVWTK